MAGKNTAPPMCKLCLEPHWGVAHPKFTSPRKIPQPKPLLLTGPKAKKAKAK